MGAWQLEPTQVILHEVSEPEGVGRRERRGGKGVSQTQGKSLKDTEIREARKREGREGQRGNEDGGGSKIRETGGDVDGETKRHTR